MKDFFLRHERFFACLIAAIAWTVIIYGMVVVWQDHQTSRCDCTVTWENKSLPIEDVIEQIGEGILELNHSINGSGQ